MTAPSVLEALDAEVAVRRVMVAYMAACDAHDADAVAELFWPDAEAIGTRDGEEQWRCSGREAVRADWAEACARLTFCVHHLTNEEITVAGSSAEGRWCYFEPATNRGTLAAWTAGRYHHTLTERDGEWRFSTFRIETMLQAPYDLGWVGDPIVELP